MFARSLSVLVGLALCVFARSAEAVIMNDLAQSSGTWQQAYINLGEQYPSVVGVYGYDGTSWTGFGSGVVISPYNVLTAAHVILNNNGSTFQKYAVVTGNKLSTDYWGIYYTTQESVIPQYAGVITSPDIGVLTFSQSINVTPAQLYTGSDLSLIGSNLVLSGFGDYGYAGGPELPSDGQKRGCQDPVMGLGYPIYGAGTDQLVMDFEYSPLPNYRYLGGKSAHGDSGGGWFTASGQLAGVNDWGTNDTDYGGVSGATSVSQHLDYIDSQIVPEPGTLSLLGSALTTFLIYQIRKRRR